MGSFSEALEKASKKVSATQAASPFTTTGSIITRRCTTMQPNTGPSPQNRVTPPPTTSALKGAWVTLHLHYPSGQDRTILGYLIGTEGGQYKLTKLVTQAQGYEGSSVGTMTSIHSGVWLVNPVYVWMVEHEQEAPREGFQL